MNKNGHWQRADTHEDKNRGLGSPVLPLFSGSARVQNGVGEMHRIRTVRLFLNNAEEPDRNDLSHGFYPLYLEDVRLSPHLSEALFPHLE